MKAIFTKGLPASGKSTWAKKFCTKNTDYVRINRDELRHMRGKYWLPVQEEMITQWEYLSAVATLEHGYNVVIDATNLNPTHLAAFQKHLLDWFEDLTIEEKVFDTPIQECVLRDSRRSEPVGADVILRMYNNYLAEAGKKIDKIEVQEIKYSEDISLPHCIIVDMDGTLADNSGRGPFDWDKVDQDKVNEHIKLVVNNYQGIIIVFSGRDGVCAEKSANWLKDNNIKFNYFYMRPQGNSEKDAVIKKRLFETHIRGKFYVDFVLDDRMQVNRMWVQELGLPVLSNNPLAKEF